MGFELSISVVVFVAPKAKPDDWLPIQIVPLVPSFLGGSLRHVGGARFVAHRAELLFTVFWAGQQFDGTFTVIALFQGDTMIHAHANRKPGMPRQGPRRIAFTLPIVAFEVTKMLMHKTLPSGTGHGNILHRSACCWRPPKLRIHSLPNQVIDVRNVFNR
jgi:hypothetical protein